MYYAIKLYVWENIYIHIYAYYMHVHENVNTAFEVCVISRNPTFWVWEFLTRILTVTNVAFIRFSFVRNALESSALHAICVTLYH